MIKDHFIAIYWGVRKESITECAEKIEMTISFLNKVDESFKSWHSANRPKHLQDLRPIEIQKDFIQSLLMQGQNVGDFEYRFHGRGCLFKYPNDEIDIDFGMGGRFDGFDAYRLKRFLAYRKDRFPLLQDEKEFDKLFKNLVDTKYIIKDPRDPDDHLYFINNNF
jgi:hypothetical protein